MGRTHRHGRAQTSSFFFFFPESTRLWLGLSQTRRQTHADTRSPSLGLFYPPFPTAMPDRQCVYNSVKLEIGKAPRDAARSSGSRQHLRTPRLTPPVAPSPPSAAPSYLAGRLGAGEVLSRRRARVGMRQVGFAVPWREPRQPQHPRGAGASAPPSPLVLLPSVGQLLYWAATAEMSIPYPHDHPWPAAWRRHSVSCLPLCVRGVPEAAERKSKMPPSPEL